MPIREVGVLLTALPHRSLHTASGQGSMGCTAPGLNKTLNPLCEMTLKAIGAQPLSAPLDHRLFS